MNVFKIQLKLLSVLYEYNNNLNGAEPVSLNKITIVNGDGLPVNVKRDKQPGDNEVENNQRYSCPSCTNNVTEEVKKKNENLRLIANCIFATPASIYLKTSTLNKRWKKKKTLYW